MVPRTSTQGKGYGRRTVTPAQMSKLPNFCRRMALHPLLQILRVDGLHIFPAPPHQVTLLSPGPLVTGTLLRCGLFLTLLGFRSRFFYHLLIVTKESGQVPTLHQRPCQPTQLSSPWSLEALLKTTFYSNLLRIFQQTKESFRFLVENL